MVINGKITGRYPYKSMVYGDLFINGRDSLTEQRDKDNRIIIP